MIYLIGGTPRAGKSTLARSLSSGIKCDWISMDWLLPAVGAYVSNGDRKRHLSLYDMFCECGHDNDLVFEKNSPKDFFEAHIPEAKYLWQGTKNLIKHKILYHQDFIIEGVYLLPELVTELKEESIWSEIKTVYLVKSDKNLILEGVKKNKQKDDWLLKKPGQQNQTLDKAAESISIFGNYLFQEAKKHGLKAFVMDRDFGNKLKEASLFISS